MKRIIYIEDDKDTAEIAKVILEGKKHKVEIALCGKEGITKMNKEKFDLALLDLMLPDISGWQVYEKVKGKKTKFAIISSLPVTDRKRKELRKIGISDYIVKPFNKKILTERINKILSEA